MQCPRMARDMNGDGVGTVSDLWLAMSAAYHWPGNKLIEIVAENAQGAAFFEITYASCSGWWAFAFSTAFWFLTLGGMSALAGHMDRY